ncbi:MULTISPECIES: 4-hydroxybenzoate 3-monooxygenase [unclassified Sphingomonas]|uniref:4-hydroxybenzoate 3-monooxygenase n=1 Tax=unclassified Sphingomonas TaxID=196159 RepID=UPI0006F61AA0|nr:MULTISPECIES: 4-hydroxybenzoate 3-monooxygenase [unclassified Sphingomonas]KRB78801.1 4-hydroxybenzoate 3-monooxygenase [Sphingomonas sp. Root710]KRB93685.1 4-hydroxybenzoate 3-monooxygenase [Sphingomonas sp. Root720]
MRTSVAIIGCGPAGLLLAHLLHCEGIDCVVLEARSRDYVEARIRAGVLEQTTVDLLRRVDVDRRLDAEGLVHHGFSILVDGEPLRIDLADLVGRTITIYGQTELTRDLIEAALARGIPILFEANAVALHDIASRAPAVTCRAGDEDVRIDCDFIAGCDGFHGASRSAFPADQLRTFEKVYPFGWLGILADVPPCKEEVIYASHERGFALASMRSKTRSRYYIQVPADEPLANWPDERLWDELEIRLGPRAGSRISRGPALEKSVAPLRSFVAEPMRHGRLFLAGDAAHVVPPTGAKGLNLAASDVAFLADAFARHYRRDDDAALESYAARALARVWKAVRFSWWLTGLTHRFPGTASIDRRIQLAELDYIRSSRAAQMSLAENYAGLPL